MSRILIAAFPLILSLGVPAAAQPASAPCPADLPFLSAQGEPVARIATAAAATALSSATLSPEQRADLSLQALGDVHFAVAPERAPRPGGNGGMVAFTITDAGRYRVELGSAPWVDIVHEAALIPSVSHGHGPQCSGIRKIVDFDLAPGDYILQLSGSEAPAVRVRVTRLP